jgi:hypothetical protein
MKNFLIFLLALLTQASLSARREIPEKIQSPDRTTPEPKTPFPRTPYPTRPQPPKHDPREVICFAGQK